MARPVALITGATALGTALDTQFTQLSKKLDYKAAPAP